MTRRRYLSDYRIRLPELSRIRLPDPQLYVLVQHPEQTVQLRLRHDYVDDR
jgi:hypothetical protein